MDGKLGSNDSFAGQAIGPGPDVTDVADVVTAYGMELSIDASQHAEDEPRAAAAWPWTRPRSGAHPSWAEAWCHWTVCMLNADTRMRP